MTHYTEIEGHRIQFECRCAHPDLGEDNCCPTRQGNCADCRHCKADIVYGDLEHLLKAAAKQNGGE